MNPMNSSRTELIRRRATASWLTILLTAAGVLQVSNWVFASPVLPEGPRLHVELKLEADRTYSKVWALNPSAVAAFEADPDREIRRFQLETRRALARRQGYRPEVYGRNYHQMVRVLETRYRLEDRRGRTILEGRVGRGLRPPA